MSARPTNLASFVKTPTAASLGAVVSRGLGLITSLLMLPTIAHTSGSDSLAVFLLATALPTLIPAGDLGLGGIVQTAVAVAGAESAVAEQPPVPGPPLNEVLGAFFLVSLSCAVIFLGLVAYSLRVLGSGLVLGALHAFPGSTNVILVVMGAFLVSVPLQAGGRILAGLESVALAQAISAVGPVFFLIAGTLLARLGHPSLFQFVCVWALGQLIAGFLGLIAGWRHLRKLRLDRISAPSRQTLWRCLSTAFWWVVIATAAAASYQMDPFVVAHIVGGREAASYALGVRVFGSIQSVLVVGGAIMWSRSAAALDEARRAAVFTAVRRLSVVYLVVSLVFTAAVVAFRTEIFENLSGSSIAAQPLVLLFQGLVMSVIVALSPYGMALVGRGHIRIQALLMAAMSIVNVACSFALANWLGAVGPAMGSLISQIFLWALPLWALCRRYLIPQVAPSTLLA